MSPLRHKTIGLLRVYLAIALFITGATAEAEQLVDPLDAQVSPGVQLNRYVLEVMRAIVGGGPAASQQRSR